MLENIKQMILEKKEYLEASKLIFEGTVESDLDDLIVLNEDSNYNEDGLKDTVLSTFISKNKSSEEDIFNKYYGTYISGIQKELFSTFDEVINGEEFKTLSENKDLIKEVLKFGKKNFYVSNERVGIFSGSQTYDEGLDANSIIAKALAETAKKFISEHPESKKIFTLTTTGWSDASDHIPGIELILNTPKKISLNIDGESKSFTVQYEEKKYEKLGPSILGLNLLAEKESVDIKTDTDTIIVKPGNILQIGEKDIQINKVLNPSIISNIMKRVFGESFEFDESTENVNEDIGANDNTIDKDSNPEVTGGDIAEENDEPNASSDDSIDTPENSEDDLLDSPVEDSPSSDFTNTDLIGKQTNEPVELGDDDILSVTIDLKSNTMTDILPIPPDNAGEAVNDDILSTRVDSGFEESSYNESVIGGIVATVLIAPILISGAMAATLLISHKLNERSVMNKIKKSTGKDLTASELKKKINSDLNDFYHDVNNKFSKLFEGTPEKNTVFGSANVFLKEVRTSKESSDKIVVADHDVMVGQCFIIKRTNLKKLEALANKHPLFKIAITEDTGGDLLYDDAYDSIKNGSLDIREESFRDPDLLKDILKTYAFVSMHVLVDLVAYVQNSFNESAFSFLEAISLGADDESATDESGSTEETPDENDVTSAVKDKVAEAESEEDPPTDDGSDEDMGGSSSAKEELMKKLSSITKSLEDAKNAVLKSL